MPKRAKRAVETIDELVVEIQTAEAELVDEIQTAEPVLKAAPPPSEAHKTDIATKRSELVTAIGDGELEHSATYVSKASAKVVQKLHADMLAKRMARANAFVTDMILSKFAAMLGGFDAIESPEVLDADLKKDALLRRDLEQYAGYITPFIPAIGLLSGASTVTRHVFKHLNNKAARGAPSKPPSERTKEEVAEGYDTPT